MPYTPARLHLARISALTELLLCVNTGAPLSPRALTAVAEHCQQWARGKVRALPSLFLSSCPHAVLLLLAHHTGSSYAVVKQSFHLAPSLLLVFRRVAI